MDILSWLFNGWLSGGIFSWIFWIPIAIILVIISALVAFIKWIIEKAKTANENRVKLKESKSSILNNNQNKENKKKSKKIAVVLAIIFSIFSWIYTYKKNYKKFWISLSLTIFFIALGLILFIYYNVELNFPYFINLGLWIWAIVDNSVKNDDFYLNYPNA